MAKKFKSETHEIVYTITLDIEDLLKDAIKRMKLKKYKASRPKNFHLN